MSSPLIWGGNGSQLLQAGGINRTNGQVLLYNGNKNYLTNPLIETGTTTGWGLGTVSLTSAFPSGTPTFGSGASGNLTLSAATSAPLQGSYSLSYASSAATTAGNFVASDAFTVDVADQGKVLTVQFYYQATSNGSNGNFSGTSSNSFGVALYDVTAGGANWIMPAGVWGMTQSSGAGLCTATFQSSVVSGQQYRLVIFNANASAGAITLYFDQFSVGPQTAPIGAAVADLRTYTATLGATTTPPTLGTTTVNLAQWGRVGDRMILTYQLKMTGAGSAGSGTYLIPLPSGYSMDTSKISVYDTTRALGASIGAAGLTNSGSGDVAAYAIAYNSTNIAVYDETHGAFWGSSNYSAGASTLYVSINVEVPILGWSSNVEMSNDTDTRVVAARSTGATATVTGSYSDVTWSTINNDTHAAFNATSSATTYTIPVTGYYKFSGNILFSGTGALNGTVNVSLLNSTTSTTLLEAQDTYAGAVTTTFPCQFSFTDVLLNAGTAIKIQVKSSATVPGISASSTFNYLGIERTSGPSVIAATDTVAASYYCSTNQSASTSQQINFDTKEYDYTNSTTTGSGWVFTAPIAGLYQVLGNTVCSTSGKLALYKNGSLYKSVGGFQNNVGDSYGTQLKLNAGDTVQMRPDQSVTFTGGSLASASTTNITILKVGN